MLMVHAAAQTPGEKHAGGRVTLFAGSELGINPHVAQAAHELGALLALHHLELVFGGTIGGPMGIVAETLYNAGGKVTGVVPATSWRELHAPYCTELLYVADLRERKAKMGEMADAFVVLPGGAGTLDELIEVLTLSHLGQHHKPIALCNTDGFFAPFLQLLDHLRDQGLVTGDLRRHVIVEPSPALLLSRVFADQRWLFAPLPVERKAHDC